MEGTLTADGVATLSALESRYPVLRGWDRRQETDGLPVIDDSAALLAYWQAVPVIHPIFARLFHYARPFNEIRPLGVGDLKVVKQWLVAYEPGEISDIHNVMLGEEKVRVHRRLEKTEEAFSYSTSTDRRPPATPSPRTASRSSGRPSR